MTNLLDAQKTPRFASAFAYACKLHEGQLRKGTRIPYVSHVLGVASIALEFGASEDEAIAALLHDGAEDAGGAPVIDEIGTRFGAAVAAIVAGCSDTFETPKPPWLARKQAYISHLATASPSVLLVSAADKLHNVRTLISDYRQIGEALWSRFTGGRQGTLWYYRSLADCFLKLSGNRLAVELDLAVHELEGLAKFGHKEGAPRANPNPST
jgi:(p)ppGpp synthase/HD superfamily hydrolase